MTKHYCDVCKEESDFLSGVLIRPFFKRTALKKELCPDCTKKYMEEFGMEDFDELLQEAIDNEEFDGEFPPPAEEEPEGPSEDVEEPEEP